MKNCMLYLSILLGVNFIRATEELAFVVVVPSYKNEQWVEKNVNSILDQNYSNYRVIYINDCSPDQTMERLYEVLTKRNGFEKFTIIDNKNRCLAMANLYNAIHSCRDDEIIVLLDGDDWFPDGGDVLSYLNEQYRSNDIWLTYGEFLVYQRNTRGFSQPFSAETVRYNLFRKAPGHLPMSHLKTFYSWLFKRIKLQDFIYEGDFYKMTYDKAIMAPLIEMASHRYKCINKILYIYNESNPINDFKVNMKLQHFLCDYILNKPAYKPLSKKVTVAEELDKKTYTVLKMSEVKGQAKSINLLPLFQSQSSDFIVFVGDSMLDKQVLQKCMLNLELTGALVARVGTSEDLRKTGTSTMTLSFDAIAWQHECARGNAKNVFDCNTCVIRKDDLIRLIRLNAHKPFAAIEADDLKNVSLLCEV